MYLSKVLHSPGWYVIIGGLCVCPKTVNETSCEHYFFFTQSAFLISQGSVPVSRMETTQTLSKLKVYEVIIHWAKVFLLMTINAVASMYVCSGGYQYCSPPPVTCFHLITQLSLSLSAE